MRCVFHSVDFDGKCSAAIVKNKFPYCELIPYDYGKEFPWDSFNNKHEEVYMVDVSLPINTGVGFDMLELNQRCDLVWIDHHEAVIKEANSQGFNPKGLRRVGEAACELTWQFLHIMPIPKTVRYLGRYDVFDRSDPNVLIFQNGMKIRNTSPSNSEFWNYLFFSKDSGTEIDKILKDGTIVSEYIKTENKTYSGGFAFETEIDGYPAIAINKGMANSLLFEHVWKPTRHDIMIAFCMRKNGTKWKVSLYTDKDIDVSAVARKFGGNGHKKAAGFVCNELPFKWHGKESMNTEV